MSITRVGRWAISIGIAVVLPITMIPYASAEEPPPATASAEADPASTPSATPTVATLESPVPSDASAETQSPDVSSPAPTQVPSSPAPEASEDEATPSDPAGETAPEPTVSPEPAPSVTDDPTPSATSDPTSSQSESASQGPSPEPSAAPSAEPSSPATPEATASATETPDLTQAKEITQCTNTYQPTSGSQGRWIDSWNWSTGVVPGAADTVCVFRTSKDLWLPTGSSARVRDLYVADDVDIDIDGSLTIDREFVVAGKPDYYGIYGDGKLTLAAGAVAMLNQAKVTVDYQNYGSTTTYSATIHDAWNSGRLNVRGWLRSSYGTLTNQTSGVVRTDGYEAVIDMSFHNFGRVEATDRLIFNAYTYLKPGSTLSGLIQLDGTLAESYTLKAGERLTIENCAEQSSGTTLTVQAGARLSFAANCTNYPTTLGGSIDNYGEMTLVNRPVYFGSQTVIRNFGTLRWTTKDEFAYFGVYDSRYSPRLENAVGGRMIINGPRKATIGMVFVNRGRLEHDVPVVFNKATDFSGGTHVMYLTPDVVLSQVPMMTAKAALTLAGTLELWLYPGVVFPVGAGAPVAQSDVSIAGAYSRIVPQQSNWKTYLSGNRYMVRVSLPEVTALAPSQIDRCNVGSDTYTIPGRVGVQYYANGVYRPAGTYSTAGVAQVTVTARAASGYALVGATTWYLNYTTSPCPPYTFSDVPSTHPFYSHITWLATQGITKGYPDGRYGVGFSVLRGEMAAFLYRSAGSPYVNLANCPSYRDVPSAHQFYKEICWMTQRGIAGGYSDGRFGVYDATQREQMAVFLYRASGSPVVNTNACTVFNDVPRSSPFFTAVCWARLTGITSGYGNNIYGYGDPVLREQMATFLYRWRTMAPRSAALAVHDPLTSQEPIAPAPVVEPLLGRSLAEQ